MADYKYLWGSMFIIMGIFLAFMGRKIFKAAVFIAAAMLTTGALVAICYIAYIEADSKTWITWVSISASFVIGLAAGFVATKLERMGGVLLGIWAGSCIGILLNTSFLYLFGSQILFWTVNLALGVVLGVIAFKRFNEMVVLSTSIIGSFFTMRGIGMYFGGFPNEYVLLTELDTGFENTVDPVFYAYLAAIVLMTILSVTI